MPRMLWLKLETYSLSLNTSLNADFAFASFSLPESEGCLDAIGKI